MILIEDDNSPDAKDDISLTGIVEVHIERMDTGHVWMGAYRSDGKRYVVDIFTPRNGRLCWRVEEDWL